MQRRARSTVAEWALAACLTLAACFTLSLGAAPALRGQEPTPAPAEPETAELEKAEPETAQPEKAEDDKPQPPRRGDGRIMLPGAGAYDRQIGPAPASPSAPPPPAPKAGAAAAPGPAPAKSPVQPARPGKSSGDMFWSGRIYKNGRIRILANNQSTAGTVEGDPLPGVPVTVDARSPIVVILRQPDARDGFQSFEFQVKKSSKDAVSLNFHWALAR